MAISRAELLMAEKPKQVDGTVKLRKQADEMYALKATLETRGWKTIIGEYLRTRLTLERFLQTKDAQSRHEVYGALKELQEFVNFIEGKIQDGEKAARLLSEEEYNG